MTKERLGWVTFAALISTVSLALANTSCWRSSANTAETHRNFEGFIDYHGVEGAPPGRPWTSACVMKDDVFRCDLTIEGQSRGVVGMRGSVICYQPSPMVPWIHLDLATVGMIFSLLPASLRHDAIAEAQAQTSWTGRTDTVLGHTCYELESRTKDGLEHYCYSHEDFFAGADQLIPVLRQMGYDNTFIGSMSKGGIGWKGQEWDKSGAPKMVVEATRIERKTVDPSIVANVCH